MSAGVKRPRSYVDNGDNVGVTEGFLKIKEDPVYIFRWNIKNFNERLQSKKPMKLMSPVFRDFNDEKAKPLQWQLRLERTKTTGSNYSHIFPPDICALDIFRAADYFCVYLHLVNYKKATKVALQFDLLNSEKSQKTVTKDHEFTSSPDNNCSLYKFVETAFLLHPENKLLEDDTLKINCRITIKQLDKNKKVVSAKAESEKHLTTRKKYFASDIANLYNSSTLSDVSIKTKSTTLKAHKAILSCRSPVFCDMFQNIITESINSTVEILDFEANIVEAMLKYIYCGDISQDFLLTNCRAMCNIAVNYGIKGLTEDAEKYIARRLSLENVVKLLIYADKHDISNLKARSITFFNMNKAELIESGGTQQIMDYKPSLLLELYQQTY